MPHIVDDSRSCRIAYIDFLKFVGLTGIFIAHVDSPSWAMMLRSFDVPMMVIISSFLAERSYKKYISGSNSELEYYISRIKRLVIPTWIFLVFYFVMVALSSRKLFSLKYYIASFALTRYGIGYVWIVLIYLYSAMFVPFFNKIGLSIRSSVLVISIYILYEIMFHFGIGTQNVIMDTTFYYIVPYGLLTFLGFNYSAMSKITKNTIVVISGIIFITLFIYYWIKVGTPQKVQIAKYPPRMYYLGYGIAWSFGLLLFCENHQLKIYDSSVIKFISKHSMWIYLWHILVLTVYENIPLPKLWIVKLIIVYSFSCLAVMTMNRLLDLISKKHDYAFIQYLRG